ncbi:hypothetical protein GFM14_14725 [Rhizobium leguminosarum bv. viciae]|uniref:hypothetical protein n=1 Tax=Rhizobium leguminosarum TaxID=384 RepID=UPI0014428FF1|nr:hypothetical protein [Rhizobium leguminosarum]NKJ92837.1 hypothetical protein [Rhizobium leguminosarum bv. viciae]NKK86692.1 hypothetical protein [Rhizobium leguminosarum bv. viciae]
MDRVPAPSELMRLKHPERYSDSERVDAFRLGDSEFRHHLESLTDRNQHKDFENFCRKLCEREISPNLRPQTGPEGGGDGKVDTETYPVAKSISERWYVTEGDSAGEYWAFAFSAKKTWSTKVRSDVAGIVGVERGYHRIIFVTSRPTRQADRLRLEQELSKQFGVKVNILDREWIVDRVFSHGHKDIAFKYLHAGEYDPTQIRLGPNDFRRQQALDRLEDSLIKSGSDIKDTIQAISDSLEAAILSRQLEKPRFETDGRFKRAIRLAKKYGPESQVLRAVYEEAWTAFWWFDDTPMVDELYEEIEALAFPSGSATELGWVHNVLQLLVSRVANGFESSEDLSVLPRLARLNEKLRELVDDSLRPSNSLHAETLLALTGLNEKHLTGAFEAFDATWDSLIDITGRAGRLAEFPAEMIDSVVSALSDTVPDSPSFDVLVEGLAELMAERNKELSAAEFYVSQGKRKLDREKPIDAIRWLGRAVINFAKKESQAQQAEALYYLSTAYHNSGLLWAAYATGLASLAKCDALSRQGSDTRSEMLNILGLLRSTGLNLGAVVDCLAAHQFILKIAHSIALDEENLKAMGEEVIEFDRSLACWLAILPKDQIARLKRVPDVLELMGLVAARTVLLYRLGYLDTLILREGFLGDVSEEEAHAIMASVANQPMAMMFRQHLVILDEAFTSIRTTIIGVAIDISVENSREGFLQAQTYAASIEGFTATLLHVGLHPSTDRLQLTIKRKDISEATVEIDRRGMVVAVVPSSWTFADVATLAPLNTHLLETAFHVLMQITDLERAFPTLEKLVNTEKALDRASFFSHSGLFREWTMGDAVGRVSNWDEVIKKTYPLRDDAPADLAKGEDGEGSTHGSQENGASADYHRHDAVVIDPIVKMRLWKSAYWSGVLFGDDEESGLPCLCLLFNDRDIGRQIFEEWLSSLGREDLDDKIRVALIKGVDRRNEAFYRMHVRQNESATAKSRASREFMASMNTTMEPENTVWRDAFIERFKTSGAYLLMPASRDETGQIRVHDELAILKRGFYIRDAWEIGLGDADAMAFRPDDDVVVPLAHPNAPIHGLLEWLRTREPNKSEADCISDEP